MTSATEGPWKGCAKTPIVPLTYKRANVEAGITAMAAAGNTLIAEGVAWGWRVLSPTEPFTKVEASTSFPADTISTYHHPRWLKIMVIMTDGDNDISAGLDTLNGTTYTAYGRGKETLADNRFGTTSDSSIMGKLDDAMSAACTQAKAEGIELYVTSFGSGVSAATKAKLTGLRHRCGQLPACHLQRRSCRLLQPHRPGRAQQVDLRQQISRFCAK